MIVLRPPCAWPARVKKTLFLVGPSPRDAQTPSWRNEALQILEELEFDGVVFVPEPEEGFAHSYIDQVEWEREKRLGADIKVCWVPREMKKLPGLTTNVEFAEDCPLRNMLYGRPADAPRNRYLDARWRKLFAEEPMEDLRALLVRALQYLGEGAEREGVDATVPLGVWRMPAFQSWRSNLLRSGNELKSFELHRVYANASAGGSPMETRWAGFVAGCGVWDGKEQRLKNNEFFLTRGDATAVAAFWAPKKTPVLGLVGEQEEGCESRAVLNTSTGPLAEKGVISALDDRDWSQVRVVLAKELRQAVSNAESRVYELPGGSSPDPTMDPFLVACEELFEEAGLRVEPNRLTQVGSRQMAATILTHQTHVFVMQLTDEEAAFIERAVEQQTLFGTAGDHIPEAHRHMGERITLEFPRLSELRALPLDWSARGMVQEAFEVLQERA